MITLTNTVLAEENMVYIVKFSTIFFNHFTRIIWRGVIGNNNLNIIADFLIAELRDNAIQAFFQITLSAVSRYADA